MHYLLQVPEYEKPDLRPTDETTALHRRRRGRDEGVLGRSSRASTPCATRPGTPYGDRVALARDAQRAGREVEGPPLRSRPAAQLDPLPVVGPEGSARRVQAGSVHDVRGPDERHLQHVQRALSQGAAHPRAAARRRHRRRPSVPRGGTTRSASSRTFPRMKSRRRRSNGDTAVDIGPGEPPAQKPVARKDPTDRGRRTDPVGLEHAGAGEHRLVHGRAQRSVSVRLREEIQEVSRSERCRRDVVAAMARAYATTAVSRFDERCMPMTAARLVR